MVAIRRRLILLIMCIAGTLVASVGGCNGGCQQRIDDPMVQGLLTDAFRTHIRWSQRDLTYSFHNFPEDVRGEFEEAYEYACGMWSAVTPLTFHQVESGANIQVWWLTEGDARHAADFVENRDESIRARAEFPNQDQCVTQRINGEEAAGWPSAFKVRVAAHELGHSLGLQHIDERDAIMHEWIYVDQMDVWPSLHQADIDAIQDLYGEPDDSRAPEPQFPPITSPTDAE